MKEFWKSNWYILSILSIFIFTYKCEAQDKSKFNIFNPPTKIPQKPATIEELTETAQQLNRALDKFNKLSEKRPVQAQTIPNFQKEVVIDVSPPDPFDNQNKSNNIKEVRKTVYESQLYEGFKLDGWVYDMKNKAWWTESDYNTKKQYEAEGWQWNHREFRWVAPPIQYQQTPQYFQNRAIINPGSFRGSISSGSCGPSG